MSTTTTTTTAVVSAAVSSSGNGGSGGSGGGGGGSLTILPTSPMKIPVKLLLQHPTFLICRQQFFFLSLEIECYS